MSISENLQTVRNNIMAACLKSGRDPERVTLIAVSKTKPLEMVKEAIACNAHVFGENKPQELRTKVDALHEEGYDDVSFHMIGHLQTNKVKYVVGRSAMIHSVDSLHLAEAIDAEAAKKDLVMPVLIEVNAAAEETKFGVSPDRTLDLIRQIARLPHVRVKGLMTIAPYVEDPEENRVYFRALRNLSIDIAAKNIDNVDMCELSMGMTGDYMVAVEEGATFVRVGTGIFGERNYECS